jgi:aldose 1-epimerase
MAAGHARRNGPARTHAASQGEIKMNRLPEIISIEDSGSKCCFVPSIGGSITSWAVDGQNILRASSPKAIASAEPLRLSSFPLVPYSNRIGYGRFNWAGQTQSIKPNFPPEPHAIHGVGWKRAWTVSHLTPSSCELAITHNADENWPWPFVASQHLELTGGALRITSKATNLSDQAVPLAFGHHPYFDQTGAFLQFDAKTVLTNDTDALPRDSQVIDGVFDFTHPSAVIGRGIDHCYANWNGRAFIQWKPRPLALEILSDVRAAVVYIPKNGEAFCFEPVPHVNNALNRNDLAPAMPVIQAGESFSTTMILQTTPARF